MKKKHTPSRARHVHDYETAVDLLEADSSGWDHAALRELLNRSRYYSSSEYKLRADPTKKTFEGMIPVEIRSVDTNVKIWHEKEDAPNGRAKETIMLPKSEWVPWDNTIRIDNSLTLARDIVKGRADGIETIRDSALRREQALEYGFQLFIHVSTLKSRREAAKDKYQQDKPFSQEDRTFDMTSMDEPHLIWLSGSDPVYLIAKDGTCIMVSFYYPSSSSSPLTLFGGQDWLALAESENNSNVRDWEHGFWREVPQEHMYPSASHPFRIDNDTLHDHAHELMCEYNYELDDPYIMDGSELEGQDTHFIEGSEEDLEHGTTMFFWAVMPSSVWEDAEGNPMSVELPVYTADLNEGERAEVDHDTVMWDEDWYKVVSNDADKLCSCFEATLLQDNYPAGYEYEYNDQDGDRMSGYSRYRNYLRLEIEPPKDDKDIVKAQRWVKQNMMGRGWDDTLEAWLKNRLAVTKPEPV